MLKREDWLPLARKLDWEFSYVSERDVFPEPVSGSPWLERAAWQGWDEPYRTSYREYVQTQHQKESRWCAVREAIGRVEDARKLDRGWLSAVKLHSATFALAEFAAVVGNLRAARFGRDSSWRIAATYGALDELRHTQLPLLLLHDLEGWDHGAIAEVIGTSPGMSRQHLFHARRRLRELLGDSLLEDYRHG